MKKFLSVLVTIIIASILAVPVSASGNVLNPHPELGTLLNQTTYVDEDGNLFIESLYGPGIQSFATNGSGTYSKTKDLVTLGGTATLTGKVSGYFTWDSVANTCSVSSPSGSITYNNGWTITNQKTTTGTGGLITKNAYVDYTFTRAGKDGVNKADVSLKITCDSKGSVS